MKKFIMKSLRIVFGLCLLSSTAQAQPEAFDTWLRQFENTARSHGISNQTLQSAFANVRPIPRVIELDNKQPEKKIGFDEYQKNVLTPLRVSEGRRLYQENKSVLEAVSHQYGVPASTIVALWGMETSYGKNTGGFDIIASLATLAWEGRRREQFTTELIEALKILQGHHVSRADFKGSWAGAMGQVQFMPSSWQNAAVDYNHDGRKDIWTTRSDAFASAANLIDQNGWASGQKWGREVKAPARLNPDLVTKSIRKPVYKSLSEWSALGVRGLNGSAWPSDGNIRAFLMVPVGANGKAYLGYNNLGSIMKWNNSTYFAISVAQLSDAIASQGPISAPRPAQVRQSVVLKNTTPTLHYND